MAACETIRILIRVVALALLVMMSPLGCADSQASTGLETVTIKGHTFHLDVAADEHARRVGLMHRENIADNGGMIFIYPRPELMNFWMGHCLVDIDIIFLDSRGRITAMHRMKAEEPQREGESDLEYNQRLADYGSRFPAQFAIELRAGWLEQLDLRVEDQLDLDLDRLKKMAR